MSDIIPIVTPVGELHYVNIAGQGKLNYNEDGYNYVATINLTGEKAESLKAKIDEIIGEIPKGKNLRNTGYRELLQDEEGIYTPTGTTKDRDKTAKPTGIFAFSFSTQTKLSDGRAKKISVYNSSNPPTRIDLGDKKIGNGSKGAISGKMQRYEKGKDIGISLYLNAVQLVDFVEYTGDAGFEAQEGGYIGDENFQSSESEKPAEATQAEAPKKKLKL